MDDSTTFPAAPPAAIVSQAVLSEAELIAIASESARESAIVVGRCAFEWKQNYATAERTDAWFAERIGLSESSVRKRRVTYEAHRRLFEDDEWMRSHGRSLSWSHFNTLNAARPEKAKELLEWAADCGATCREMLAYGRLSGLIPAEGEGAEPSLAVEPKEPEATEATEPLARPKRSKKKTSTASQAVEEPAAPPVADDDEPPPPPGQMFATADPAEQVEPSLEDVLRDLVQRYGADAVAKALRHLADEQLSPEQEAALSVVDMDVQSVVEAWNELTGDTCKVRAETLNRARRELIRRRLSEAKWRESFVDAMKVIASTPAFQGETQQYKPTIDWFLRPSTVAKLVEGQYSSWGAEEQRKNTQRVKGKQWQE